MKKHGSSNNVTQPKPTMSLLARMKETSQSFKVPKKPGLGGLGMGLGLTLGATTMDLIKEKA